MSEFDPGGIVRKLRRIEELLDRLIKFIKWIHPREWRFFTEIIEKNRREDK